jgi:hypothetical protein
MLIHGILFSLLFKKGGERMYFDAVLNSDMSVVFSGTRVEVKAFLLFFENEEFHDRWFVGLGEEMKVVSVAQFLHKGER